MKAKKVKEFSKKIFVGVALANIIIIAFAIYMIYITGDLTPLSYLIPAAAAEMATTTGFYYSKAKAENKIKLMSNNNEESKPEDIGSADDY
jgi:hypothetical protein